MALPGADALDLERHASSSIVYALVARGPIALADYATTTGNFRNIAREVCSRLPASVGEERRSYSLEHHVFHVLCDMGLVFLVMTEESYGRRMPFVLLEEMRNKWKQAYGDRGRNAGEGAMQDDFGGIVLTRLVEQYGNPGSDKIAKVKSEIDEVKGIMTQNIEKVLARGEKIELLVDKTELLNASAMRFKRGATQLKRHLWIQNAK
eukprot:tig00000880_g5204.t1